MGLSCSTEATNCSKMVTDASIGQVSVSNGAVGREATVVRNIVA